MTHTHAKGQGQRSLGSNEWKRIYGWGDCINSRANTVGKIHDNELPDKCAEIWLTSIWHYFLIFILDTKVIFIGYKKMTINKNKTASYSLDTFLHFLRQRERGQVFMNERPCTSLRQHRWQLKIRSHNDMQTRAVPAMDFTCTVCTW